MKLSLILIGAALTGVLALVLDWLADRLAHWHWNAKRRREHAARVRRWRPPR